MPKPVPICADAPVRLNISRAFHPTLLLVSTPDENAIDAPNHSLTVLLLPFAAKDPKASITMPWLFASRHDAGSV